jgi:hypothetical protein
MSIFVCVYVCIYYIEYDDVFNNLPMRGVEYTAYVWLRIIACIYFF